MNISDHINAQRAYFNSQITKPISFRKAALIQLKKAIEKYEPDIEKALWDDLKKSKFESYITETGFVLTELNRTLKKLVFSEKSKNTIISFRIKKSYPI